MIFEDEFMAKERFVYNYKFKGLEIRLAADGPI